MRDDADAAIAEPVRAAWDHAVAHWDDPTAHDELMRLATVNICFAWLAAKYRERVAAGDEIAKVQQAKLRRAAEAQMLAGAAVRREKEQRPYHALRTMVLMLAIVCVAGLLYAAIEGRMDDGRPQGPAPRPALPIQKGR